MANKFIPEIPDSVRFENLSQRRLMVPEGFNAPETTEQIINRILNMRLNRVDENYDDGDDVDDWTLDDDENDDFPEDFFDNDTGEVFEVSEAPADDAESKSDRPSAAPNETVEEEDKE